GGVVDVTRRKEELILENMLLRQQLVVLQRQVKRPKLTWRERFTIVLLARWVGERWHEAMMIVQPDTVIRWHRDIYRMVWRQKSKAKGKGGRPPLAREKVNLIRQMALENRLWGAERIHGELLKLGTRVSKSTIQKYIWRIREGLPRSQSWKTFLHNHGSDIWACDFLQTYDVFFRTVFVFVIIELGSRQVVYFNVTRSPSDGWVAQQIRNATPFGEAPKFLIKDNDKKYGEQFLRAARGVGIDVIPTPIAAPKANAHCERFIGTLRRDCLDHMIIMNDRQLSRIVKEYATYYNECRPHQGIGQRIPSALVQSENRDIDSSIISLPVLGGLHHDYRRRAA
ncbi:integrase core domain-containing protein, partial [Chloroflexota bacterium]